MPIDLNGLNLRLHDDDSIPVYEGRVRADLAGRNYVRRLKEALWEMGFCPFPEPVPPRPAAPHPTAGQFDALTELAVREFQYYASGSHTAVTPSYGQRTADRRRALTLSSTPIPEASRYKLGGPPDGHRISGVVNARTRELLSHWHDSNWHCPVIIESYTVRIDRQNNDARVPVAQVGPTNLWLPNQVREDEPSLPSFFVRDYSKRYANPADPANPAGPWHFYGTQRRDTDLQVLGKYHVSTDLTRWPGGPFSSPRNRSCWAETEVLPETCGVTLDPRVPARVSTFKVIRAVAEQECLGFFDGYNAWDDAFFSPGLIHWTIGRAKFLRDPPTPGEFGGLLAFTEARHGEATVRNFFGGFGLTSDLKWRGAAGREAAYNSSIRAATSWYVLDDEEGPEGVDLTVEHGNLFKTWHWLYRFIMASRTNTVFWKEQYAYARLRLREIGRIPWPDGTVPDVPQPGGPSRKAVIADVFSSEQMMALVLRLHVLLPSNVVNNGGKVAGFLVRVYRDAEYEGVKPSEDETPPNEWPDGYQTAFVASLLDAVSAEGSGVTSASDTFKDAACWPNWRNYPCRPAEGMPAKSNSRGYRLTHELLGIREADFRLSPLAGSFLLHDDLNTETNIAPKRYGGHHLQPGDYDEGAGGRPGYRYGGEVPRGPLPPPGEGYVAQLQRDLRAFGFSGVEVTGFYDAQTEAAVRELQAVTLRPAPLNASPGAPPPTAKYLAREFETTATRWRERLEVEDNAERVKDHRPGVVDDPTRKVIVYWLERRRRYPVVFESSTSAGGDGLDNLWSPDAVTNEAAHVSAWDFRGYYTIPDAHNPGVPGTRPAGPLEAGAYRAPAAPLFTLAGALEAGLAGQRPSDEVRAAFQSEGHTLSPTPSLRTVQAGATWRLSDVRADGEHPEFIIRKIGQRLAVFDWREGGPWVFNGAAGGAEHHHCWPEAEFKPRALTGAPFTAAADLSTFRVLRAVAEQEFGGFCDSVQAWGPRGVTLGFASAAVGTLRSGDLGAFLAYHQHLCAQPAHPSWLRDPSAAFKLFGLGHERGWLSTGRDRGRPQLFDFASGRYVGQLTLAGPSSTLISDRRRLDALRSWPWVYRLAMAARTFDSVRRAMWDFGLLRLRELGNMPWPNEAEFAAWHRATQGTLRHVYTSEAARALLLLWHMRYPGDVIAGGAAAPALVAAFRAVNPAPAGLPSTWDDAVEARLLAALRASMEARNDPGLTAAVASVLDWPRWRRPGQPNPGQFTLTPQEAGTAALPEGSAWLSLRRASFLMSEAVPPPVPTPARPAAVRLRRGRPAANRVGMYLLGEPDPETPGRQIATALALNLPSAGASRGPASDAAPAVFEDVVLADDAAGGPRRALTIPFASSSTTFTLPPAEETSDESFLLYDRPFGEAVETDAYAVRTGEPGAVIDFERELDLSRLFSLPPNMKLTGRVRLRLEWADGELRGESRVVLRFEAPFLPSGLEVSFGADGDDRADFTAGALDGGGAEAEVVFSTPALRNVFENSPLAGIARLASAEFRLSYREGVFDARLRAATSGASVQLGTPLVRLDLPAISVSLGLREGLEVRLADADDGAGLALNIDLFKFSRPDQMTIGHLWEQATGRPAPSENDGGNPFLLRLVPERERLPDGTLLRWNERAPSVSRALIERLFLSQVSTARMKAFAGNVLGMRAPMELRFAAPAGAAQKFSVSGDGSGGLRLTLELITDLRGPGGQQILRANGRLAFTVQPASEDPTSFIRAGVGAFAVETVVEVVTAEEFPSSFSDLVELIIPAGTRFSFDLDPRSPSLTWASDPARQKVALKLPGPGAGSSRFTFEMDRFKIGAGGFDLKASVLAEKVPLGDEDVTGFQRPLAVKPPAPSQGDAQKIGEIVVSNSRIVRGSLQAVAQLGFFDDAVGTFTLVVAENETDGALEVLGTLDIATRQDFHVKELFATFEIDLLHLETRYHAGHGWKSGGSVSGRVRFTPPAGRSADETGEIKRLFRGVVVEFENVNPVHFGVTSITIETTPIEFGFAELFTVIIRGVRVRTRAEGRGVDVLGDIRLAEIPGIGTKLDFSGITINRGLTPSFNVRAIGAEFSAEGGFVARGTLERINDDREFGFGGVVSIRSSTTPEILGLLKLTRVRVKDPAGVAPERIIPAIVIYVQQQVDVQLPYGFFLRKVGVGLGISQGIRGLNDRTVGIQERIMRFVDNPAGIPFPGALSAWQPMPAERADDTTPWMFVASGLITFGKLPPERPHPLTGTILLAIDERLDIVAATNIWLFTSMDDSERDEFIRNPTARGAIGISPRERKIFGYFRTLPSPKMGDEAPALLRQVLSIQQTSLAFVADPDGFVYELGWPWELTFGPVQLGPLRGVNRSGCQFGIYRGVISFGYNYAIEVVLDASVGFSFGTVFGRAGAGMSVHAEARLQCQFAGALDQRLRPYLYGRVAFSSVLSVRVWAFVEFSFKIAFVRIRFRISFDISFSFAIRAELAAAFDSDGLGFDGIVAVSVSICGYRLEAQVPLQYRAEKIAGVAARIAELQPAPILKPRSLAGPVAGPAPAVAPTPQPSPQPSPTFDSATLRPLPAPAEATASTRADAVLIAPDLVTPPPGQVPAAAPEPPVEWQYFFTRVPAAGREAGQLRVIIFPVPGARYPDFSARATVPPGEVEAFLADCQARPIPAQRLEWFRLNLKADVPADATFTTVKPGRRWELRYGQGASKRISLLSLRDGLEVQAEHAPRFELGVTTPGKNSFVGFLGEARAPRPGGVISWGEHLDAEVLTREELLADPSTIIDGGVPADVDPVTVRSALLALREEKGGPRTFDGDEEVDPRPWSPNPSESDDHTTGIAPPDSPSPNLKTDTDYDRRVAAAAGRSDKPIPAADGAGTGVSESLLVSELVEFAKAPDTSNKFRLARGLRLVLVFADPGGDPDDDPVARLVASEDDRLRWKVNGLASVLKPAFARPGTREYDLITGPVHQDDTSVCLVWDLRLETKGDGAAEVAWAYEEVSQIVVTRENQSDARAGALTQSMRPCWLNSGDKLVRPQFQFTDRSLDGVKPGHVLQYTVEVLRFDGKVLARAVVYAVRHIIKPLSAPLAAEMLHTPARLEGGGARRADWFAASVLVVRPGLNAAVPAQVAAAAAEITRELKLRYRTVQAPTTGLYAAGGESHGPPLVRPPRIPALDDGRHDLTPGAGTRAEAAESRGVARTSLETIPWEETLPVANAPAWTVSLLKAKEGEPPTFLARLVVDEAAPARAGRPFWSDVGEPAPGRAVEFFVGVERPPEADAAGVTQRSKLLRCRHAVRFAASQDGPTVDQDGRPRFADGTTVAALEPFGLNVPAPDPASHFVHPRFVRAHALYEEGDAATAAVRVALAWRHDLTGRAEVSKDFDPVVGYRVYRGDAFDLASGDVNALRLAFDLAAFVSPKAHYRSVPASINLAAESEPGWLLKPSGSFFNVAPPGTPGGAKLDALLRIPATPALNKILDRDGWKDEMRELGGRSLATYLRDAGYGPAFDDKGLPLDADIELWPGPGKTDWVFSGRARTWRARLNPDAERREYEVLAEAPLDYLADASQAGPAWLAKPVAEALEAMRVVLSRELYNWESSEHDQTPPVRVVITSKETLEDLPPEAVAPRGLPGELLDTFLNEHSEKIDWSGWAALEALGLSCECRLEDPEGKRLSPEIFTGSDAPAVALRQKIAAAIAAGAGSATDLALQFATFLAEDGRTTLDIFRVSFIETREALSWPPPAPDAAEKLAKALAALDRGELTAELAGSLKLGAQATAQPVERGGRWRIGDAPSQSAFVVTLKDARLLVEEVVLQVWAHGAAPGASLPEGRPEAALSLDHVLGLLVKGRRNLQQPEVLAFREVGEQGRQRLEAWAASLKYRLAATAGGGSLFKLSQDRGGAASTELRLPIEEDGVVECRLGVPDRWAHEYHFAVAPLRRYDSARARVGSRRPSRFEVSGGGAMPSPAAVSVPQGLRRVVAVDRSLPLDKHNALATPLPGSIQALVFTHPAAFASQATASLAARGQYSGQTVLLRRRINPDVRTRTERLFPNLYPAVNWDAYQTWLTTSLTEKAGDGPRLIADPADESGPSVALLPVQGATTALFGADRYVFPDLPGYYEYCVVVYSTAGRTRSANKATGYVTPLYTSADEPLEQIPPERRPRQQPRVVGCRSVSFGEGLLTFEFQLVHPRYHLRPEVGPLWVEAEQLFPVAAEKTIKYGSLPDLALSYTAFLCTNPAEAVEGYEPILRPLAEVLSPLERDRFELVVPDTRFRLPDDLSGWAARDDEGRPYLLTQQDSADTPARGMLYLRVSLVVGDGALRAELERLVRERRIKPADMIYLGAARQGTLTFIERSAGGTNVAR